MSNYTLVDIRSMARREGISLRGNKFDVSSFNGYSFEPYRYIAVKNGEMWEGQETGNFLPVNVDAYTVVCKYDTAKDVIDRLLRNLE